MSESKPQKCDVKMTPRNQQPDTIPYCDLVVIFRSHSATGNVKLIPIISKKTADIINPEMKMRK
mgnify:CR=1 FL=1